MNIIYIIENNFPIYQKNTFKKNLNRFSKFKINQINNFKKNLLIAWFVSSYLYQIFFLKKKKKKKLNPIQPKF